MSKLTMMVGIQGSGKSTVAKKLAILQGATLIEADVIRHVFFDDKQDGKTHSEVFSMVHDIAIKEIKNGHNVIVDATNLVPKHRMNFINRLMNVTCGNIKIIAHVVMTQFQMCVDRDSQRERSVGVGVIKRGREGFHMPSFYEGFDEINISYTYNPDEYELPDLYARMEIFDQQNKHHTLSLLGHTTEARNHVTKVVDNEGVLADAMLFHDIGKLYTQTFKDSKGRPSENAHYYNHASVSAYEAFFYLLRCGYDMETILHIVKLIQYHMRMYDVKSDRSRQKLLDLVGAHTFAELYIMNQADMNAK